MDWSEEHTAQLCHKSTPNGMVGHLKVRRRDGKDGISWDVLQQIKNEMLGEDVVAVEIFPKENEVVNEANIRHLWVVDNILPNLYQ
jgi:RNA-binding protein YhbY